MKSIYLSLSMVVLALLSNISQGQIWQKICDGKTCRMVQVPPQAEYTDPTDCVNCQLPQLDSIKNYQPPQTNVVVVESSPVRYTSGPCPCSCPNCTCNTDLPVQSMNSIPVQTTYSSVSYSSEPVVMYQPVQERPRIFRKFFSRIRSFFSRR